MTSQTRSRDGADRCPGLIAPFVSADGAMVRLRLPGGLVETAILSEITALATRFGDPEVTLTSRGSLQMRALPAPLPRELISAIKDLGLIPSGAHDKARNVLADPFADHLQPVVAALDEALLADPALASLPGRFLFAVATPGGPVLAEPYDIALVVDGPDTVRVVVDGRATRHRVDAAVTAALEVALRFLTARPDERTWNIADLPPEVREDLQPGGEPYVPSPAEPPVPGGHGDDLLVLLPLGLLTRDHVISLAAVTGWVQLTPWRSLVVPGGRVHAARLAAAGLVTDATSGWSVLSACAGAPHCARTVTLTREIASAAAPLVDPTGPPVHVIGCDRACGHPARQHVTALSPSTAADVVAVQRSAPARKAR